MSKNLTSKYVEAVKRAATRREIADAGVPGLYLVVQPSGRKSWAYRYRFGGRPRKATLGAYPQLALSDARDAARAALAKIEKGRDPAEENKRVKRERLDGTTRTDTLLNRFVETHVRLRNRESTAEATERFLDNLVRPKWKHREIRTLTKGDVIDLLDDILARGTPATANRVHAIIRKFFNWCVERGVVDTSPAFGVKAPAATVVGDRALSNGEIRLFWKACNGIGWPFGQMFQMLLLTGQRRSEVAGGRWVEFQVGGDKPVWVIPKERSKNSKAHAVPLAGRVADLLAALPVVASDAGFVFSTTGTSQVSGYSRAKARLDAEMLSLLRLETAGSGGDPEKASIAPWRLHDLRRTAASGMASLGHPVHVVEAALNHKSGTISGIAAVYNVHDYAEEKRAALASWASLVATLIEDTGPSNVVMLRDAQQQRAAI